MLSPALNSDQSTCIDAVNEPIWKSPWDFQNGVVSVFCFLCLESLISLYPSHSNVWNCKLNHRKSWQIAQDWLETVLLLIFEANRTGLNHWCQFEIWQTIKPSTNMHTWQNMYFYWSSLFVKSYAVFNFVMVSFCTNQDVRWPSFTVNVAVKSPFPQTLFWLIYVYGGR